MIRAFFYLQLMLFLEHLLIYSLKRHKAVMFAFLHILKSMMVQLYRVATKVDRNINQVTSDNLTLDKTSESIQPSLEIGFAKHLLHLWHPQHCDFD